MFQIVTVVIAIALTAILMVGGISYLNTDTTGRIGSTEIAAAGFRALQSAHSSYRIAYRAAPTSTSDLLPFVAGGLPKTPAGFSWSYGGDAISAYICLSGSTSSARDLDGLSGLSSVASQVASLNSAGVIPGTSTPVLQFGPSCGVSGSFLSGSPAAVTYRLTG